MLSEPLDPYGSGQEGVRAPPHSHPPHAASCEERKQRKWGWGRARGAGRICYFEQNRILLEKDIQNSEIDVPLTQGYGQHSKTSRAGSRGRGEKARTERREGGVGKGVGEGHEGPPAHWTPCSQGPEKGRLCGLAAAAHSPDHSDGRRSAERCPRALPARGPPGPEDPPPARPSGGRLPRGLPRSPGGAMCTGDLRTAPELDPSPASASPSTLLRRSRASPHALQPFPTKPPSKRRLACLAGPRPRLQTVTVTSPKSPRHPEPFLSSYKCGRTQQLFSTRQAIPGSAAPPGGERARG